MQVVLASPRRSPYTGEQITAPHLGLLALAAAVREGTFAETRGTQVAVYDDQLMRLIDGSRSPGYFFEEYSGTPDILGVQAVTCNLKSASELLAVAKARYPRLLTVMGGVAFGGEGADVDIVASGAADVVIRGEGEIPFNTLVYQYGLDGRRGFANVPGITYKNDDGEVVRNPSPPVIRDLDSLPLPARDLANFPLYRTVSRGRAGNIVITRGCSYACAYCYSKHHWQRGQRRSSIERVVEEVRVLVEDFNCDRIRFEDDDFTENERWVREICKRFKEANLHTRMEWEAKGRPEHMDVDLLSVMRDAGCFRIMMGVESLDPDRLRSLDRPVRVTTIENALGELKKAGVGCQATLILGIPGETSKEMRGTITWLQERLKGPRDLVSPCFYVPFFNQINAAMQEAHPYDIIVNDPEYYSGHFPVTSTTSCTFEELATLYQDMTPSREGMYPRIAHLANWDKVQTRLKDSVAVPAGSHAC